MTWGNMLSSSLKLLLLTPLILVHYNINEIAFWYLLLTINSFAIVIDFGFYPTFSRLVSYVYHGLESINLINSPKKNSTSDPNWLLMARVYGTVNVTYLFLSFFILVIVFGFTYLSIHDVIARTDKPSELWAAYIVYAFSVFISFFSKKFYAVIVGTNNIVVINRWDIVNNVANAITSILIVYFELSLFYLALNQLLFSVLLVVRDFLLERSICSGKFKSFKFFSFDKEIFQACWGPTWSNFLLCVNHLIFSISGLFL